ncbi:MAG TPA: hypothetical protein IAB02_06495 [Candidatus Pullichristensenella excrementigallinarum]|uniref:Uncharacterized protein n=1 Tax=Candidatus Pullichristensenella excrementigallinarum TaxID=2840907 RepID=A0A9D1LCX3_9FIRM|nr:hypothetical protein [Candidatus Pullichristensenella excrementigallinarum]
MDDFLEQVVGRKKRLAHEIAFYGLWGIVPVAGIFSCISLTDIFAASAQGGVQFRFPALLQAVLGALIAFAAWRGALGMRVEYDYTFTNGILDVARVLNGRRRVPLASVETSAFKCAGAVGSNRYRACAGEKGLKIHSWYLNRDAKRYFFCFEKDGVRQMMLLELNDAMAERIFQPRYLRSDVWDGEKAGQ